MCAASFAGSNVTWLALSPIVQLGLALLGLGHDGVDAGIVFELLETSQVVCVNDFHEACLTDRARGILVEEVPEGGPQRGALENHVFEGHLGRALAIHDHLRSTLLQPRSRQSDQYWFNSVASQFLQQTLSPNCVESPRHLQATDGDFHAAIERMERRHREVGQRVPRSTEFGVGELVWSTSTCATDGQPSTVGQLNVCR